MTTVAVTAIDALRACPAGLVRSNVVGMITCMDPVLLPARLDARQL